MPFLAGRGQASRGYFGGGTTPDAPTLGTITTSISAPNTISTPSMSEDDNNASFSWSAPSVGGVTLSVPFTEPAFNGGLPITDYEYSTDNGSTWKSSGSTTSPISITTVSASSSNLSSGTSYTVKLRAKNSLGSGVASSGSSKTTPAAINSYTIQVYNNRGTETLAETISDYSTTSYSRSHLDVASDWSIKVAAVNAGGTGTFSSESNAATGYTLTANYSDSASCSVSCTDSSGCDDCGTKTGSRAGTKYRTCNKWTRGSTVHLTDCGEYGTCNDGGGACGSLGPCSGTRTYYSSTGTYDGISYTAFEDSLGFSTYLRRTADGTGGCGCDSYYAWSVSYCTLTGWRHEPIGCVQWVISCG